MRALMAYWQIFCLLVFMTMFSSVVTQAAELPQALKGVKRIVVLGDSITQGGGSPGGYVWLLDQYLRTLYPDQQVEVLNAGISGHKATDMQARFQRDVLDKKPDLVTINVGINDVWHGFRDFQAKVDYPKGDLPGGVPLPVYREKVQAMITAAKNAGIRVVLVSPTIIHENLNSNENQRLVQYVSAMRALAKEHNTLYVDLHTPFQQIIRAYQTHAGAATNLLTTDGVHMNRAGYQVMAYALLRGLGVPEAQLKAVQLKEAKQ